MHIHINKRPQPALLPAILLCILFAILAYKMHIQPHVDEVWSYMLSNKTDSPFLYAHTAGVGEKIDNIRDFVLEETDSYQAYFNHWHDGTYYHNALTVQPGERFSYDRVYYNQTLDVHPPMYYFALHTVCSFFPDQFSWDYAFAVNLIFYIGTMVMIYLIAKQMAIHELNAVLAAFFWGASAAGIHVLCFLRMYMMLTFLIMCVVYLHMRMIRQFRMRYVGIIFILDILCFLTQYYAYICIFFLTLFTVLFMFRNRKYCRGILFGCTVLLSVGISVAFFPAALRHVFSSVYSPEATAGKHLSLSVAMMKMVTIVIENYTGFAWKFLPYERYVGIDVDYFPYVICLLLAIPLLRILKSILLQKESLMQIFKGEVLNCRRDYRRLGDAGVRVVLFSAILSACLIIWQSPDMGTLTVRYLFVILPVFAVLAVYYAEKILSFCFRKTGILRNCRVLIIGLLVVACVAGSHLIPGPSSFLVNRRGDDNGYKALLKDSQIILADKRHHTQALTCELQYAARVYPTDCMDDTVGEILNERAEVPVYLVVSNSLMGKEETEAFLEKAAVEQYDYIADYYCSTDDPECYHFYRINAAANR